MTNRQFIIKIKRVKQLLLYNDMTLSEIAWKLHYSSTSISPRSLRKLGANAIRLQKVTQTQFSGCCTKKKKSELYNFYHNL
jgi:AraC-like DNA-binding protein